MDKRYIGCELCWFAATGFSIGAVVLVLFGFDPLVAFAASPLRLAMIVLAAIAFGLMALLGVVAMRLENDT